MIVYVLEVDCYEDRYIAGVFASPEAAKAKHAPTRPLNAPAHHSYEWADPDEDGRYRFGADWSDVAYVTPYEVEGI